MEKWTDSLTRRLGRIQNRIESILETDPLKRDPDAPPFEASRDPSLVDGISLGLPDDHIDRAIILFSRLALLFDGGLLLENHDGRWKPQALFNEGVTRTTASESSKGMSLPDMNSLLVLKTSLQPLCEKLGFRQVPFASKSANAYVIRPVADFAYVVVSDLPDLWLKEHLERTSFALSRGFSE